MEDNLEQHASNGGSTRNAVLGLLFGSLAGAAAMLLFAPHSGKKTRAQIQQKSMQLRDQTSEIADSALAQVRSEIQEITAGVREMAGKLKQRGLDNLAEQLDRVSGLLDAGKKAVKDA